MNAYYFGAAPSVNSADFAVTNTYDHIADLCGGDSNSLVVTMHYDAIGDVMVRVESEGNTYVGRGGSTDIIVASAKAYVNALNRLVANMDIKPAAKAAKVGP